MEHAAGTSPDGRAERTDGAERSTGGPPTDEVDGLVAAWLPLSEKTRITARVGARFSNHLSGDASRIIPAWEDDVLVSGGPESNRAVPIASQVNNSDGLLPALMASPGTNVCRTPH